ncbi:cellulose biosynthesis cyclic di-GMP-binding regulatory protein BcsB [Rhizobium sp. NPDC090275]|uniref:cellulose biosynthesis cyclic di-GMP-binding regulatory protein BcsB n=1 Tax=Rhizobium sp. NPDC090275 TaxID=3364498 RepID=UPI00383A62A7
MRIPYRYKLALAATSLSLLTGGAFAQSPTAFSLGDIAKPMTPAATATTADDSNLRRIGATRNALFFNGESTSREYAFYALPAEIAGSTKLVLSLQTSISTAPESSAMRVFVNDQDVGTIKLTAGDPYRAELKVPNGLIQPGYNAVSILVDQKHRVDCTIDATYELWTQVDPEQSGFVFGGKSAAGGTSIPDLIALGGINDGRTPIHGRISPGASTTEYNRIMAVIQSLAIAGNFDRPAVTIGEAQSGDPGIDVVVGTRNALASTLGADRAAALKDGISVLSNDGTQRKMLVITGQAAPDVNNAVEEFQRLSQQQQNDGTPQGLRALANTKGRPLAPNSVVPLQNLGFIAQPFTGRLYKESVNFSMPSDFYPGDYGSLVMHLSARYAANLARGAELILRANGETVADITLGASRNGLIDDQRLPIPLSKLRPGENIIEFEARLPTPADAVCDPLAGANEDRSRLSILGSSFLEVPSFARVGRYPDIAALVSGASLAAGHAAEATSVYVPDLNSPAIDAAGSFLAKMAYSSGRVTPVDLMTSVPDAGQRQIMAFAPFARLPAEIQSQAGLDLSATPAGLTNGPPSSRRGQAAASMSFGDPASGREAAAADTPTQLDKLLAPVTELASTAKSFARSTLSQLQPTLGSAGETRAENYQPKDNTALLIAQKEMSSGGVWTVVASPSDTSLTATVDAVMERSTWTRLNGSLQSFSTSGQVMDQVSPRDIALFQTQPVSIGNMRLIIAGWLSNHVMEYTLAQLGAAIMLGASTFLMLKLGRRK